MHSEHRVRADAYADAIADIGKARDAADKALQYRSGSDFTCQWTLATFRVFDLMSSAYIILRGHGVTSPDAQALVDLSRLLAGEARRGE